MNLGKWNRIYLFFNYENPMKRAMCTTMNKQFAESGKAKGRKR